MTKVWSPAALGKRPAFTIVGRAVGDVDAVDVDDRRAAGDAGGRGRAARLDVGDDRHPVRRRVVDQRHLEAVAVGDARLRERDPLRRRVGEVELVLVLAGGGGRRALQLVEVLERRRRVGGIQRRRGQAAHVLVPEIGLVDPGAEPRLLGVEAALAVAGARHRALLVQRVRVGQADAEGVAAGCRRRRRRSWRAGRRGRPPRPRGRTLPRSGRRTKGRNDGMAGSPTTGRDRPAEERSRCRGSLTNPGGAAPSRRRNRMSGEAQLRRLLLTAAAPCRPGPSPAPARRGTAAGTCSSG